MKDTELTLYKELTEEKEDNIKIGYKGTNHNMFCKNVKYEVGKTYFIADDKSVKETHISDAGDVVEDKSLKLCSNDVLHYCNDLVDVDAHYSLHSHNRFFEVQVLGRFIDGDSKSGTTRLKFLRELNEQEVKNTVVKHIRNGLEKERGFLDLLQTIQKNFPCVIIGGSLNLYLRGYNLKRFSNWEGDIDLISPYWVDLTSLSDLESYEDEKNSGNDFDDTFISKSGIKLDLCISPESRYEMVNYKGVDYKVNRLIDVIEAKARYAVQKGGQKHLKDLEELLENNKIEL